MRYSVSVEDIKRVIDIREIPVADLLCNDVPIRVKFARQKTGFGYKVFMVCPQCGERRVKLYLIDRYLICRTCIPINVYKGMQHTTKGGCDYITYIMGRFAQKNGIDFKRHPFHYYEYDKPKYKHWDKWRDSLTIMQALANMRFQTIFMKKIWDTKTIDSVLNFNNKLLYIYDLVELDERILNWDIGVKVNT